MKLTKDNCSFYNQTGYLHLRNPFNLSNRSILEMQKDVLSMISYAKKGYHSMIRVYDDFPHYIDGINIASIEDPIAIMPDKLKSVLENLSLQKFMSELIDIKNYTISLVRFHVTGVFKYQGSWHQDIKINGKKSILANFYFFEEQGFKFLHRNHRLNSIASESYISDLKKIPEQIELKFLPGDLCFFDPFVFHKPYSAKKRCHLHLRLDEHSSVNESRISNIIDFKLDKQNFYLKNKETFFGNTRASIRRHINLIKYFIPSGKRSNIFL